VYPLGQPSMRGCSRQGHSDAIDKRHLELFAGFFGSVSRIAGALPAMDQRCHGGALSAPRTGLSRRRPPRRSGTARALSRIFIIRYRTTSLRAALRGLNLTLHDHCDTLGNDQISKSNFRWECWWDQLCEPRSTMTRWGQVHPSGMAHLVGDGFSPVSEACAGSSEDGRDQRESTYGRTNAPGPSCNLRRR
jgi:hypothetical protein